MHTGNARSIAFGLIASLTLSLNLVALPTIVQATTATCNGLSATITSSARVITGTSGADVIVVQGSGVHTVSSGLGDDVICGSSNDDTIISGTGNDTVISGAGNDTITAGDGNDTVVAGDGNDTVSTGTGDDTVSGGTGNDSVTTGSGNDKVNGDAGADSISSESGSDTLAGGPGNDTLSGGTEGDKITGETGSDSLSGGAGNDMMQGGADRDQLDTGPGTNYCASDRSDSIVGACTIDTTSPGISNASVTPTVSAGSTLTFIWTVNDNSGVDRSGVKIGGPSGWVTTWCGFGVEGTRISGTMQASVFSATCQVPANAVNTEYTAFFDATDVFGQAAKSSTANFRITGGATDASAPVVSNIALSAPSLTYGQSLDITYDVQDETGLQGVIAWVAYNGYGFANNQGRSYVNYGDYASVRLSGDEKEGKYLQRISLNDFAPAGEYTLWISVIDKLGNKVFYQTSTKFTVN